jgi:hypothetical protein
MADPATGASSATRASERSSPAGPGGHARRGRGQGGYLSPRGSGVATGGRGAPPPAVPAPRRVRALWETSPRTRKGRGTPRGPIPRRAQRSHGHAGGPGHDRTRPPVRAGSRALPPPCPGAERARTSWPCCTRPAGASAARPALPTSSASRPPPTSPGSRRSDSRAPAEPRLPPTGWSPSEILGGARQPLARAVAISAHPTPCSTRSNPHAAIGRGGWNRLCSFRER